MKNRLSLVVLFALVASTAYVFMRPAENSSIDMSPINLAVDAAPESDLIPIEQEEHAIENDTFEQTDADSSSSGHSQFLPDESKHFSTEYATFFSASDKYLGDLDEKKTLAGDLSSLRALLSDNQSLTGYSSDVQLEIVDIRSRTDPELEFS